ncbi:MAG: DUF3656 domain-containing protein [Bacilli bacterium]|nr:DUF3656 domain-containing protein [Bacilli bacterium]
MKKPELLAPAGSLEILKAVINAGCDAAYLSGYRFGARGFAPNFSDEELVEAINYAHIRGVKIYVTVNTLIYEDEIDSCMNYIEFLYKNDVDAVILQDLGLLDLVRKTYPNLEIHASTQMHIHNIEGVKFLEKLGVKRVVLARETSIDLIKEIKKQTQTSLEVFVHGALCFSYSGQCLMSSLIGNRSGNRGTCAGCCRMPYKLESNNKILNKNEYLISMKDLCTISDMGNLIESNVDSFKIEGRTKRIEYAYLVTKLYRKAIDNYLKYKETRITKEDMENLYEIFNRDFTKGYLFNENDVVNDFRPNHMGIEIGKVVDYKNNIAKVLLSKEVNRLDGIRFVSNDIGLTLDNIFVNNKKVPKGNINDIIEVKVKDKVDIGSLVVRTTNYEQLENIKKELLIEKKIKVICTGMLKENKKVVLNFNDGINNVTSENDFILEKALTNNTSLERVKEQINKIGFSAYEISSFDIEIDSNIFIPIKVLNDIKRELVDKLNSIRCYKKEFIKKDYTIELQDYQKENNINYRINSIEAYEKIKNNNINLIYLTKDLYNLINDDRKILKLNNVIEGYSKIAKDVLVGEVGSLNFYDNFLTDYSLNVTNSYALAFLHSVGSKMVTLSLELNEEQIKSIINNYTKRYQKHPNVEVVIYGRELVMTSKYDLLGKYKIEKGFLIDKFNNKYILNKEDNLLKIYNYKARDVKTNFFDISVNNVRYEITEK